VDIRAIDCGLWPDHYLQKASGLAETAEADSARSPGRSSPPRAGTGLQLRPHFDSFLASVASQEAGLPRDCPAPQQLGGAIDIASTATVAAAHLNTLAGEGQTPGAALTGGFHWVLRVRGTVALPDGRPQPPSPAARKPGRGWKVPSQRLSRRSQDTNGDRYDEAPDYHPAARDRLPVDTV
jgi:hypothetical protein